jgi:hypothetical protein
MPIGIVPTIAIGLFFIASLTAHADVDPADQCKEVKVTAAGFEAFTLMKAFGQNITNPDEEKLAQSVESAEWKLRRDFEKADQGDDCEITDDADLAHTMVSGTVRGILHLIDTGRTTTCFPATGQETCWDEGGNDTNCLGTGHDGFVRAGAPLADEDNGDGTITDLNTRLMWEKKDDAGGLRDKDKDDYWINAFEDLHEELNHRCANDEEVVCDSDADCSAVGGVCGFAGHRDWRMPNVKELVSIVDYERFNPAVDPAFDINCVAGFTVTECSCTAEAEEPEEEEEGEYWTATTDASDPARAFVVNFYNGHVLTRSKPFYPYFDEAHTRAVRGPVLEVADEDPGEG